jgi:hypothetical protein
MSDEPDFGIGHNYGSNAPRTLAYLPPDAEHILACTRAPYLQVRAQIERAGKGKWLIYLQQKAKFNCCKNPANLDIEAWYSKQAEADKGAPDVYKFYCRVCEGLHNEGEDRGYCHALFCVGGSHPLALQGQVNRNDRPDMFDIRPKWDIR